MTTIVKLDVIGESPREEMKFRGDGDLRPRALATVRFTTKVGISDFAAVELAQHLAGMMIEERRKIHNITITEIRSIPL